MASATSFFPSTSTVDELQTQLVETKAKVLQLESELEKLRLARPAPVSLTSSENVANGSTDALSLREYRRYGRQMILPSIGRAGQLALKGSHVLVVGAGGLGCPVLLYLAGAGVGTITILDHDCVELSNLHRQILHDESRIGMNKALSAQIGLQRLNSDINVFAYSLPFVPSLFGPLNRSTTPSCLLEPQFSLILDCTDNPATRHFINSYAVRYRIPLVSGGAVRAEGTVGVFGLSLHALPSLSTSLEQETEKEYGPCYACVFPPPPPILQPDGAGLSEEDMEDRRLEKLAIQGTGACSDEGVLGLLCGQVGVQMGCEAIRVLLGIGKPTLHLVSPLSNSPLRTVKLRNRQEKCPSCAGPSTSLWSILASTGEWPGWVDPLCELPGIGSGPLRDSDERWDAPKLRDSLLSKGHSRAAIVRLIDVRPSVEWDICNIQGSESESIMCHGDNLSEADGTRTAADFPLSQVLRDPRILLGQQCRASQNIVFVCRRGNDSIIAARAVRRYLEKRGDVEEMRPKVGDLRGGLAEWSREVDPGFPMY